MKRAVIAVVLGVAGAVVAHMHAQVQTYHPVVKVATPEGLVYTAVLDATPERPACGDANKRFLEPLREHCMDCEVLVARCERELGGLELALQHGEPIAHPLVALPGLRIAVAGPEATAKLNCEFIAKDLVRRGALPAACVYPPAKGGS